MNETAPREPSHEFLTTLARELRQGEELVWSGVPDAALVERNYKLGRNVGIAVLVAGVMCLAGISVVNGMWWHISWERFSILLVASFAGWVFLLNETFGAARRMKRNAAKTIYGLTRERAIVIEGVRKGGGPEIYWFDAQHLSKLRVRDSGDSCGDLIFGDLDSKYPPNQRGSVRWRGFFRVRNVREVEALMRSTLQVDLGT